MRYYFAHSWVISCSSPRASVAPNFPKQRFQLLVVLLRRNLIRSSGPLVHLVLQEQLMGVQVSFLVVIVCPQRAAQQTVIAEAVHRWQKVIRKLVSYRIHQIVGTYWSQLGQQLKVTSGRHPDRARIARHWGRLGYKLQASKRRFR